MRTGNGPAPARKAGPAQRVTTNAECKRAADHSSPVAVGTVTPFPLLWAEQLIANADGPVPEYGSAEWVQLPDESRVKVAACVLAAERYRTRHRQADAYPISHGRRAREVAEARRPRPGDYMGGPVRWDEVADA